MTTLATHTSLLTGRALRTLSRQPFYLFVMLIQPMMWLLLFGELFARIADLPGFGDVSYIAYLTPGVVIMTALFSAIWAGTGFIEDMDRGVMDRSLASPVRRGALIAGTQLYNAAVTIIQALIVFAVGLAVGARYDGGIVGILVVVGCAVLVSAIFTSVSDAVALLVKQQEALIGVSQLLTLPLSFLSSMLIAPALMPDWVASAARYNPIDWAVVASREALSATPDWSVIGTRAALLGLATVAMGWLATRAFAAYQRSS